MTIHHFTPYAVDKNLGKAYNDAMRMIGTDDWACIRDGDTMFLTPDFGDIIFNYAYQNPGAVLTSFTNRIHSLAKEQLMQTDTDSVTAHIDIARQLRQHEYHTTPCTGPLSGFLMLIPRKVWERVPFREGTALLGVDTTFYKDLRKAGVPILRMDSMYVFHSYRLGKDIRNVDHLK